LLFPVICRCRNYLGALLLISSWSKIQNCRWNFVAIFHSYRGKSTSGLNGHIAIFGCRSFLQSLFFNSSWSKTPGCSWKRTNLLFFYLNSWGLFLPQSATRARKNRSAIRGLKPAKSSDIVTKQCTVVIILRIRNLL